VCSGEYGSSHALQHGISAQRRADKVELTVEEVSPNLRRAVRRRATGKIDKRVQGSKITFSFRPKRAK